MIRAEEIPKTYIHQEKKMKNEVKKFELTITTITPTADHKGSSEWIIVKVPVEFHYKDGVLAYIDCVINEASENEKKGSSGYIDGILMEAIK